MKFLKVIHEKTYKSKAIVVVFLFAATVIVCLNIFEGILSITKIIPPFPKYMCKPQRWNWPGLNKLGFLDKERSFMADGKFHILFIGDSFMEIFGDSIVPMCEQITNQNNGNNIECINLGESATDPIDYYWRLRNIGMLLMPDMIALFIFEENDFISEERFLKGMRDNKLVTLYPQQSLFSRFFPRITAAIGLINLTVRKLLFEIRPWIGQKQWSELTDDEKEIKFMHLIVLKANVPEKRAVDYVNNLSSETKKFIFRSRYLPGYYLDPGMKSVFSGGKSSKNGMIVKTKYTVKAIIAIQEVLRNSNKNAKLCVFFIPSAAKVDPVYRASFNDIFKTDYSSRSIGVGQGEYALFFETLWSAGITVYDLSECLLGIPDTYSFDGHWNNKGMKIASEYVSAKLLKFYSTRIAQ